MYAMHTEKENSRMKKEDTHTHTTSLPPIAIREYILYGYITSSRLSPSLCHWAYSILVSILSPLTNISKTEENEWPMPMDVYRRKLVKL